jgi:hypothetical protein
MMTDTTVLAHPQAQGREQKRHRRRSRASETAPVELPAAVRSLGN